MAEREYRDRFMAYLPYPRHAQVLNLAWESWVKYIDSNGFTTAGINDNLRYNIKKLDTHHESGECDCPGAVALRAALLTNYIRGEGGN